MPAYEITPDQLADLENRFTHHPPQPGQPDRYTNLRAEGFVVAKAIMMMAPHSRERSLALTKLEEAIMWANAAIARNEKPADDPHP